MAATPLVHNRRMDRRLRPREERIIWTRQTPCEYRTGWVHDTAPSGISFITPARDQPEPGENLELTLQLDSPAPRSQSVRVVRVGRFDRFFAVVGCKNRTCQGDRLTRSK